MRPDGKAIPVDVSPDPDYGTVRRHVSGTADETVLRGEILKGSALDEARADGEPLWMRHAETCTANKPFNPKPPGLELTLAPHKPTRRHRT